MQNMKTHKLTPQAKKELKKRAREFLEKNVDIKMTIEGIKGSKVQEKSIIEFKNSLIPMLESFATWAIEHQK